MAFDFRAVLLRVVADQDRMRGGSLISGGLQQVGILQEAMRLLNARLTPEEEQALLTAWYDLFRNGHLSWGYNLNNPDPPFCHVTEQGHRALAHINRDPSNPDGYVAYLTSRATLNPLATAYVDEALGSYNANRFRAAAVMIGVASESMALELRNALTAGITKAGRTPSSSFMHINIKRVLEAIRKELEMHQSDIDGRLWEQVDAYWPAFMQQIRAVRTMPVTRQRSMRRRPRQSMPPSSSSPRSRSSRPRLSRGQRASTSESLFRHFQDQGRIIPGVAPKWRRSWRGKLGSDLENQLN